MNAKQHLVVGISVGVALNLIKQGIQMSLDPARAFDWAELAVYGGAGGIAGLVPDILEPATDPNHRRFFHSLVFGAGVIYVAHGRHSEKWDADSRKLIRTLCWGYLSHLGTDALTPKGIPTL